MNMSMVCSACSHVCMCVCMSVSIYLYGIIEKGYILLNFFYIMGLLCAKYIILISF